MYEGGILSSGGEVSGVANEGEVVKRLCESCVRDKSRRTDRVGQIASEPKLRRKINRVGNLVHKNPTRLRFSDAI